MCVKVKKQTKDREYKLPKGMTESEAKRLDKVLEDKVGATSGRKRPRNPNEKRVFERWERERGGKKIGTI